MKRYSPDSRNPRSRNDINRKLREEFDGEFRSKRIENKRKKLRAKDILGLSREELEEYE